MRDTHIKSRHFARSLRKVMTDAETILWSCLRNRKLNNHRFRRQHPVGPYIADFACVSIKLIVEVDGATHWTDEAQAYDARRRAYLQRNGWTEIRVSNPDVYRHLDRVLEHIASRAPIVCSNFVAQPLPPLSAGEETGT